jgi:hypothetical protein
VPRRSRGNPLRRGEVAREPRRAVPLLVEAFEFGVLRPPVSVGSLARLRVAEVGEANGCSTILELLQRFGVGLTRRQRARPTRLLKSLVSKRSCARRRSPRRLLSSPRSLVRGPVRDRWKATGFTSRLRKPSRRRPRREASSPPLSPITTSLKTGRLANGSRYTTGARRWRRLRERRPSKAAIQR